MPKIIFVDAQGLEVCVAAEPGQSIMRAARENSVDGIEGDCGGVCACATCHVYILGEWSDRIGNADEEEQEMLSCANEVLPNSRLGCQIVLDDSHDGMRVGLPESQR